MTTLLIKTATYLIPDKLLVIGKSTKRTSSGGVINAYTNQNLYVIFFFNPHISQEGNFFFFQTNKMQTNMYDDESQSVFVFRNPLRFLSRKGRQIGAYLSGGLVSPLFIFELQLKHWNSLP